jgi:uncharacterized membrane protein (DUF106 family)
LRILSQPITGFIAAYLAAADLWLTNPLFIVALLSVVVGLAMVLLFGYTSDQKAIARAKDELKAHLLAVRLYRDQLHVVMGSYGKVLRGTGRYLRLAFKPLVYVILPITILIVQLDRTLGFRAIQPKTPFLLTVCTNGADEMNNISIELPPEIASDAPPVHVAAENEVVWRLIGNHEGSYLVKIIADGQTAAKTVRVSSQLARVSPIRLRGHFWERMFLSGESALPGSLPLDSISVTYPERDIPLGFGNYQMNWIWLFLILSMIAGFIFKELLGIQI